MDEEEKEKAEEEQEEGKSNLNSPEHEQNNKGHANGALVKNKSKFTSKEVLSNG